MKRKAFAFTWFALLLLSGCASYYPLPVVEPKAKTLIPNPADLKKTIEIRTKPDYERGGLLPPTNATEAVENLKIYADTYQSNADRLRRNEYTSSDIALGGGVLGVLGAVVKSPETAIAGALIASGAAITSNRYHFLVQATNYEKASDAMYCMYGKLYPNADADTVFVREKIDEVRRKLRKNQSLVELTSPDLAKLEASLIDARDKKEKKNAAQQKLIQKRASGATILTAEQAELDAKQLEELQAELTKCVAQF